MVENMETISVSNPEATCLAVLEDVRRIKKEGYYYQLAIKKLKKINEEKERFANIKS